MKQKWLELHTETQGVVAGVASAICLAAYLVINKYIFNTYAPSPVEYSLLFALAGGLFGAASLMHRMDRAMYIRAKQDAPTLMALAGLSFIAVGLLVIGQRYTTTVNVALLSTLTIVATMMFSYLLLRERPSSRQLLWLVGLFAGLYIGIVGFHVVHPNKGDAIVLISIAFFGLGNALARKVMRRQGSFVVPNIRLTLSALLALVASVFLLRHMHLLFHILPWALLSGMFYWLTMKTFAVSVHNINANHAVVLNNSQIVFTSLAGVAFLGETYSWEKFIGSAIALISIYYISWKGRQ